MVERMGLMISCLKIPAVGNTPSDFRVFRPRD